MLMPLLSIGLYATPALAGHWNNNDITVTNVNSAYVKNNVEVSASTGSNDANGGSGSAAGNGGNVQSKGSFKVKFYVSTDAVLGSGDTLVFTKTLKDTDSEGRIKPGNTANVSGSATISSPTQGKYLIAHIDSDNAICESNESNNIATRQIP